MVRLGQDSKAPLYFSSEERRPGSFSYHHRVYNSDGSELQAEYPSHHIMNSERDQFSGQPDVNQFYHFDQHQQHQHQHQHQHDGYSEDNSEYYSREKEEEEDVDLSPYYSKLQEVQSGGDLTSYYSRRDQEDLPQYHENPVSVPRYEESFRNDQIEYTDIDLSDDYDDYGMELEFEQQLNRIEDGAGLHYVGDNLIPRDNAKVYVSSDFSTARESGGDTVDFVYDLDFTNY